MPQLGSLVKKIRSKNAGPFWLTIDVFCEDSDSFKQVSQTLDTAAVASLFQTEIANLKRFDIDTLNVIKFSLPRPQVQGTRADRDMHGASFAVLLEEMTL